MAVYGSILTIVSIGSFLSFFNSLIYILIINYWTYTYTHTYTHTYTDTYTETYTHTHIYIYRLFWSTSNWDMVLDPQIFAGHVIGFGWLFVGNDDREHIPKGLFRLVSSYTADGWRWRWTFPRSRVFWCHADFFQKLMHAVSKGSKK